MIKQQTRGWSEAEGKTFEQRSKEDAQDYRYMPDADIPPVVLTEADVAEMQAGFPLMPADYRAKFARLELDDSVVRVLLSHRQIAAVVSDILDQSGEAAARRVANLFASCLPSGDDEITSGELDHLPSVAHLIKLAQMLDGNKVSSTAGKEIFAEILQTDADPLVVAESKHLLQVSDEGAIEAIVDQVIAAPGCAKAVADFKSGQDKVIGFLVGQVMKQSKGQANPALAQKILRQKLK